MTRTDLFSRIPPRLLPQAGETALCAVSGGVDSMCLLHLLSRWQRERGGQVLAAHFNHRLRGGFSDRDETFVREICAQWEIPLTVGQGDVAAFAKAEDRSPEEAARMLRYAFLQKAAEEQGCKFIYTAHHAGDNAETVLLNLIRGTGLRGLAGMESQRGNLRRPLLEITRAELEDYAAAWGIPHIHDETNDDPDAAARNLLRLRVMPLLKELNPRAVEHINSAAGHLRAASRALEEEAARWAERAKVQPDRVTLAADVLSAAPEAVRPLVLLRLWDLLDAGRQDLGAVHINAVLALAQGAAGEERRVSLPHGVTARVCRRQLILERRPRPLSQAQLLPGQPLSWGDYVLTLLERGEGDGIALCPPREGEAVTVAPCRIGERLTLPGSRGGRGIKRLCQDRQIPPEERERLPAIYVGGRLAAVGRLGTDVDFLPKDGACWLIQMIKKTEERDHEE